MVLTDYGKELYSKGDLRFEYYAFSDDGVDYDPYISDSGSLSDVALSESIDRQLDSTLTMEATTGLTMDTDVIGRDRTNINRLLFTMPQGQSVVPELDLVPDVVSASIGARQQKVRERSVVRDQFGETLRVIGGRDIGYRVFGEGVRRFDYDLDDFFDKPSHNGFIVRVYTSGTDGPIEMIPKRDRKNVISYGEDFRVFIDEDIERLESTKSELSNVTILRRK